MNIVNLSELDPAWNWLATSFEDRPETRWAHISAATPRVAAGWPRRRTLDRIAAAWATRPLAQAEGAVLVSHGPRMTMYGEFANRVRRRHRPFHLAYSFNFTTLPSGPNHRAMQAAFKTVDRFVVFSRLERQLYVDHFGIDERRIDMLHWAVKPPAIDPGEAPLIEGDYLCAIGGQGRDYALLAQAMRKLPAIRLVIVASPDAMQGVEVPANVDVRISVPAGQARNILAHGRFVVLPPAGAKVPCGHVTLVSAMHLGKAIVATRSEGIADYVRDGVNGRMTEAGDTTALALAIAELHADAEGCRRLGEAGRVFAAQHCVEASVVAYFGRLLEQMPQRSSVSPVLVR